MAADKISFITLALAKGSGGGGGGGDSSSGGKLGTLSLATAWTGDGPYTQEVSVSGYTVTANTVIHICPDSAISALMTQQGVEQIYLQNNNCTVTAVAIGAAPMSSLTLKVRFEEVES